MVGTIVIILKPKIQEGAGAPALKPLSSNLTKPAPKVCSPNKARVRKNKKLRDQRWFYSHRAGPSPRCLLNSQYVTGFVDAEGLFFSSLYKGSQPGGGNTYNSLFFNKSRQKGYSFNLPY